MVAILLIVLIQIIGLSLALVVRRMIVRGKVLAALRGLVEGRVLSCSGFLVVATEASVVSGLVVEGADM